MRLLLLTHGHVDHVWDAARIQREHGCPVGCHPETVPMVSEPEFFRRFGFALEVETLMPEMMITETPARDLGGVEFQVLEVPGHCPGSLCFFSNAERVLFGGDVLFAGGVGRWDLPGGDKELLFTGIRTKAFPLGDDVKVLPGHGPATTIGAEREGMRLWGKGPQINADFRRLRKGYSFPERGCPSGRGPCAGCGR